MDITHRLKGIPATSYLLPVFDTIASRLNLLTSDADVKDCVSKYDQAWAYAQDTAKLIPALPTHSTEATTKVSEDLIAVQKKLAQYKGLEAHRLQEIFAAFSLFLSSAVGNFSGTVSPAAGRIDVDAAVQVPLSKYLSKNYLNAVLDIESHPRLNFDAAPTPSYLVPDSQNIQKLVGSFYSYLEIVQSPDLLITIGEKGTRRYSWNILSNQTFEYHIPKELPPDKFALYDVPHNLAHIVHLQMHSSRRVDTFTDTPSERFFFESVAAQAELEVAHHDTIYATEHLLRVRHEENYYRLARFLVEGLHFNGTSIREASSMVAAALTLDEASIYSAAKLFSPYLGLASAFHVGPAIFAKRFGSLKRFFRGDVS